MAKLAVTRELVGKVVRSSYATHQKVKILLYIYNNSGLLVIEIDKLRDRY